MDARLAALRRERDALRRGDQIDLAWDEEWYLFARPEGKDLVLIAINRGKEAREISALAAWLGLDGGFDPYLGGQRGVAGANGRPEYHRASAAGDDCRVRRSTRAIAGRIVHQPPPSPFRIPPMTFSTREALLRASLQQQFTPVLEHRRAFKSSNGLSKTAPKTIVILPADNPDASEVIACWNFEIMADSLNLCLTVTASKVTWFWWACRGSVRGWRRGLGRGGLLLWRGRGRRLGW